MEETRGSNEGFINISMMIEELEKDITLPKEKAGTRKEPRSTTQSSKEEILGILTRAADDRKFLARLAEDPRQVLDEFNLTSEQKAALASGDLQKIESWVGKLDKKLCTWIWCRLQQEKW
jgi:hypothetical protein